MKHWLHNRRSRYLASTGGSGGYTTVSLFEPVPLRSYYGLLDLERLMHESCRIQMHDILLRLRTMRESYQIQAACLYRIFRTIRESCRIQAACPKRRGVLRTIRESCRIQAACPERRGAAQLLTGPRESCLIQAAGRRCG